MKIFRKLYSCRALVKLQNLANLPCFYEVGQNSTVLIDLNRKILFSRIDLARVIVFYVKSNGRFQRQDNGIRW